MVRIRQITGEGLERARRASQRGAAPSQRVWVGGGAGRWALRAGWRGLLAAGVIGMAGPSRRYSLELL